MHQLDHHGSGNLWKLTEPATNTQLPIFRYNVHRSTRQHRSYRVSRQLARFRKIKVTSNRGSHQMKAQDKHGNWFPGVYYEQGKTSNAQSLSFIPPFSFCGVVTLSQSPFFIRLPYLLSPSLFSEALPSHTFFRTEMHHARR